MATGDDFGGHLDDMDGLARVRTLHEALRVSHKVAIIGDPGSGKTTLLRFVARKTAEGWLSGPGKAKEARDLLGLAEDAPLPVPVLSTLHAFNRHLKETQVGLEAVKCTHVEAFLAKELASARVTVPPERLEAALREGRLLLLLDGLDEVPGHEDRQRVAKGVRELLSCHKELRVVLTSRTRAFDAQLSSTLGLDVYELQAMSREEENRFLTSWHRAVYGEGEKARQETVALLECLERHRELRKMSMNPHLLTLIAVLKYAKTELPDRRVELYSDIIDLYLERWDLLKGVKEEWEKLAADLTLLEKRKLLAELAWEMHAGGEQGRTVPAKVPIHCLGKLLLEGGRCKDDWEADEAGQVLLDWLELRSGLLVRRADGIQFAHLGYQEHLVALKLSHEREETLWEMIEPHLTDDWWNEVIRLLVAQLEEGRAGRLLLNLIEAGTLPDGKVDWSKRGRGIALAFGGLEDLPGLTLAKGVRDRVMGSLSELTGRETKVPVKDRIEALLALGQVGDPRLGMEKPERWVWFPPGEFTMGDDDLLTAKEKKEYRTDAPWCRPAHRVELTQGFWLGKYPVTNREYREFVDAGGYGKQKWWSEEGWWWRNLEGEAFDHYFNRVKEAADWYEADWVRPGSLPRHWTDDSFKADNQPVVGVSWYEAEAYCRWLTERIQGGGLGTLKALLEEHGITNSSGVKVLLPTETQWEYASRGRDGRRYPWGNEEPTTELANYYEGKVGRPTPVGAYPRGAGPAEVYDLAGNVWEWCRDIYEADAYKARKGSAVKDPLVDGQGDKRHLAFSALRGGGWAGRARGLRSAGRNRFLAGDRYRSGGFRCLLCPEHGR